MSGMAEQTLLGVPLTTDFPVPMDEDFVKDTEDQKAELEQFGLKVTGIHVLGEGATPRFFIEFPPGQPSFEIRARLEASQYDVGQQMGDKMLRFYVTRRVKRGDGWQV
jgi:hypothetical protein